MWRSTEFGTWHFSDDAITKVGEFAAQFHPQDYSLENFNPWGILFGNEDPPSLLCQRYAMESEDESDDEPAKGLPATNDCHNVNRVADAVDLRTSNLIQPLTVMTLKSKQVTIPLEEDKRESQSDEATPLPLLQSQELVDKFHGGEEADGIAEHIDLLENGPNELDLTSLPNTVVIEVFRGLTDRGLCHAIEAVCIMKPTDQARFNSIVITDLLLPRLEKSDVRCSNQVKAAFGKFISCCPAISCQQFLAPAIIAAPTKHMDTIMALLRPMKQTQKDLILTALLESLSSMDEPHLALFSLLIGKTENSQLKQQLVNILAQSVDKFPSNIQFGKMLLAVIRLVTALPDLKTQLTNVVNRHESVVKNTALALLRSKPT